MPRTARVVIPGCAHHITQRGNNKQDVFFVDDDRQLYLQLLIDETQKHGLEIQAYCLMPNHVHLIAVPTTEQSLAKGFGRTNFRYAKAVNHLHGRCGHLWQSRFYSCSLDEEHYWRAMQYVEQNPVRAGMVKHAWQYAWSSAAAHCGKAEDPTRLLDMTRWAEKSRNWDWAAALQKPQDKKQIATMRKSTHTGRPLGSDSFISKMETVVGRRLRPLPIGRPRKSKSDKPSADKK